MGFFDNFKKLFNTKTKASVEPIIIEKREDGKVPLKLIELFSGIGFTAMGINDSNLFDVDSVATCDLDNNAVIAYAAAHCGMTNDLVKAYNYPSREDMAKDLSAINMGYDFKKQKPYDWQRLVNGKNKLLNKVWLACELSKNLGDINLVKKLPQTDLITWSFPCTSLSVAGKLKGFSEEGESSVVFEFLRLMRKYDKNELPSFLLMENVKNLVGKKFIGTFEEICAELEDIGYNNYWKVLNTKNTGVPQNRERCFMISVRKDIDTGNFTFPTPFDNGTRLKDVLEENPDEKLYITNEKAQQLIDDLIADGTLSTYEVEK